MAAFRINLIGCPAALIVEAPARDLTDLVASALGHRFICGVLVSEGGDAIEPPLDVLVPLSRVQLVALDAGDRR
jgi:hypothetical protein